MCLALIGMGPTVMAHEQTASIMIRSDGSYVAPHSWECSSEGNVDYTRVFCTPPEIPDHQSKWCGEKVVSLRALGRGATTGRLEVFAWCTTGGGANAECMVPVGTLSCSDSEPAHPEYLLWGNQVACQVTHSGVDARWMGKCQVTVGHSPQTTPVMNFVKREESDDIVVTLTEVDREWVYVGLFSDVQGARCQLNAPATLASQCYVPDFLNAPAHYEGGIDVQAGDFLSLCAEPGSAAALGSFKIGLQWNPTEELLASFVFDSLVTCA